MFASPLGQVAQGDGLGVERGSRLERVERGDAGVQVARRLEEGGGARVPLVERQPAPDEELFGARLELLPGEGGDPEAQLVARERLDLLAQAAQVRGRPSSRAR